MIVLYPCNLCFSLYYSHKLNTFIFVVESSAGLLMTTTSRPSSACSKQNSDSISIESESDLKRYYYLLLN